MTNNRYSKNTRKIQATWKDLHEYLHPLQWAFDHPSHCGRKEEIRFALEHKGEKGCCTFDRGGEFPYRLQYIRDDHFEQCLDGRKIYYVSNGQFHKALLYLDCDHHDPHQSPSDTLQAKTIINDTLAKGLGLHGNRWVSSPGGQNGYLPIHSPRHPQKSNEVFQRLENALRLVLADAGCLASFEIKGKFAYRDAQTGEFNWKQFGKLPMSAEDFNLQIYENIFDQKVSIQRLERFVSSIEHQIPQEVLTAHKQRMEELKVEHSPTHVLLTPDIEAKLRSRGTWKQAMVTRRVLEDGEWVLARYLDRQPTPTIEIPPTIVEPAPTERPDTRSTRYWSYVKDLATNGLPTEDNLAEYLYELSRPLLFREFFKLPMEERINQTIELLKLWVLTKHNDRISRLATKQSEVLAQVERVVRSAANKTGDDVLAYYAMMRANDQTYPHRIQLLAPLVRSHEYMEQEDNTSCCKRHISEPIDSPLPGCLQERLNQIAAEQRMRRKDGEFPFIKFARRLLNACWANKGRASINRETLLGYLDNNSRDQQVTYKKLLAQAGLIHGDWENYIKRHKSAALYRLTKECQRMFVEDFQASQQRAVG